MVGNAKPTPEPQRLTNTHEGLLTPTDEYPCRATHSKGKGMTLSAGMTTSAATSGAKDSHTCTITICEGKHYYHYKDGLETRNTLQEL